MPTFPIISPFSKAINMAEVRFNLKDTGHPKLLIYLTYVYEKGKRLRYHTDFTILKKHWDDKRQRPFTSSSFPRENSDISIQLDKLASEAISIKTRFKNERVVLDNTLFKRELDIFTNKVDPSASKQNFIQFFEQFINNRKQGTKRRYSEGSIEVYCTTLKKVKDFVRFKKCKFDFPEFDASFFENFLKFLFDEGFKDNYVHKVAITLKTVLIEAERENVCPSFRYDNRWLKATKREAENIYLTIPELEAIEALDLRSKPGLDKARDLFLIGCNTGLRYSDFSNLKKEFFKEIEGVECLVINTQKTGQIVVIPINDVVQRILEKYNYQLPKGVKNQKVNEHLKTLGKMAGIDQTITLHTYRNGIKIAENYFKYEKMTSHTARRSFASNLYHSGANIRDIMQLTGHKMEKEFQKYLKLSGEEYAVRLAQNPFFKRTSEIEKEES